MTAIQVIIGTGKHLADAQALVFDYDRVHPGHARKMAARLRAHGYDVSYYENVEGGHGAAADNEQAAFVAALTFDFLGRRLRR